MLSANQLYLVSTQFTLFLWAGSLVDLNKRRGSLDILKAFMNSKLFEQINYTPSYLEKNQNTTTVKLRIEHQYYESQRFRSFFKKAWTDDKLDYVMLRLPKQVRLDDKMIEEGID